MGQCTVARFISRGLSLFGRQRKQAHQMARNRKFNVENIFDGEWRGSYLYNRLKRLIIYLIFLSSCLYDMMIAVVVRGVTLGIDNPCSATLFRSGSIRNGCVFKGWIQVDATRKLSRRIVRLFIYLNNIHLIVFDFYYETFFFRFAVMGYCWAMSIDERPTFTQLNICLQEFYAQLTRYV